MPDAAQDSKNNSAKTVNKFLKAKKKKKKKILKASVNI